MKNEIDVISLDKRFDNLSREISDVVYFFFWKHWIKKIHTQKFIWSTVDRCASLIMNIAETMLLRMYYHLRRLKTFLIPARHWRISAKFI